MTLYYIIAKAISYLFNIIQIAVLVRCVLSFLPQYERSAFGRFIMTFTEPILAPCRNLWYKFSFARNLPFDLSPIIALLLLQLLASFLLKLLFLIFQFTGLLG